MRWLVQENVGGTTYFYQGAAVGQESAAEEPAAAAAAVGVAPPTGLTMYPGTPTHVVTAKAQLAATDDQFYMADDVRLEMLHKNAVTLTQSDPAAYPGKPFLPVCRCH